MSEGRGTTKPFLVTGAPWVDSVKAAADLNARRLPGVLFRPAYFQPSKPGEKFNGQMCGGVEIYFTDRKAYRAVSTTLHILDAYRRSADPTAGSLPIPTPSAPMAGIGSDESVERKVTTHQAEIEQFLQGRKRYLLY